MLASSRLACFWPGLAAAWYRGNTSALAIAIISAWTLMLLLLATFVWPEWVSVLAIRGLWLIVIAAWAIASARSQWQFSRLMQVSKPLEAKDSFLQAQVDYLAGSWFEAEAKLLQILHDFPRDAESQLLLVGVLRHTRRYRPALRRLAQLETLDSATRWRYEIMQERAIIERRIAAESAIEAEGAEAEESEEEGQAESARSQAFLPGDSQAVGGEGQSPGVASAA